MVENAVAVRVRRLRLGPRPAAGLLGLVLFEAAVTTVYLSSPAVGLVGDPVSFGFTVLQPFIWIDIGVLAVVTTRPLHGGHGRLAVAIATGYFFVLAFFGGLIGPGSGTGAAGINWVLPPGYSPRLYFDGAMLALALEPYKIVGYASLAYLVYVNIIEADRSVLSGVVGVFTCVSCTWPVIGTVTAGILGGSSVVATAALDQAYPLSTLVYLSAVILLWWRPAGTDR